MVSLSGGPVVDLPDTKGFELAQVAPWITNQPSAGKPRVSGELRDVATGKRLRWKAAPRRARPPIFSEVKTTAPG
jgi:hypothetical protein